MAQDLFASRRIIWMVATIMLVLFVATNLPWQLDDYDQAKQAFTSFEMVKEGHWLYQRTPHERIATKPPLVGWISAATFELTRSWDLAWRLPSLAAAVALSILLLRSGNSYGTAGGLVALSAFGFNLLTPRLASLVRTDMPLALVVFAIGLQIWQHVRERRGWSRRDRWLLLGLLTAAMLIKGPIVYAFLLPGVVVMQLLRRGDAERDSWSGWWPWLGSLSIFLAWVIGGSIWVPKFYDQVVLREFLGRFGETVHRPQPIYFYLPHLLHKFAPWSVLMIALAIVDFRHRKVDGFKPSSSGRLRFRQAVAKMSPDVLWLICWSVGGLLFLSLVPSKRVDRIFPVVPPLCLLLAAQMSRRQWRARLPRWLSATLLLSILFSGSYSGFKIWSGYNEHRDALVKFGRFVRAQAAANHWRYEVVESSDEGLLLYSEKLHFVNPNNAVEQWQRGEIDALLAPEESQWRNMVQLQSPNGRYWIAPPSARRRSGANYVLLVR